VDPGVLGKLDAALNSLGDPHKFELAMIRSGLASCCVYLSYSGIQIRPIIPPTHENLVFAGAGQRIYLSATLGPAGELERAFGRAPIVRVPLPTETKPRSGRRLFVFPDLAATDPGARTYTQQSDQLITAIVATKKKALVLSQDTVKRAEAVARELAPGLDVWGKDDLRNGLEEFATSASGVLGLSNRYDGLDLPGEACRIVVLNGKPSAANLAERFLGERADAGAALAERLRTRIVQGAGRCTRGPNDYAVVTGARHGFDPVVRPSREHQRPRPRTSS
jgi:Rad3-related DNA helicase